MTKHEYMAMSVLHGLKCHCIGLNHDTDDDCVKPITLEIIGVDKEFIEVIETYGTCPEYKVSTEFNFLSDVFPILRNLSDLTKEISQKDYNNGEPFDPLDELRANAICDADHLWLDAIEDDLASADAKMEVGSWHLVMLLLKWHFDLITEDCEKVYVTDKFDPYR